MNIELFLELARPYAELLLPIVFFGFFLVTGVAILFSVHKNVRRAYVGGFLVVLLLFQTIMPLYFSPFINWHKFSEPRPVESTGYEIRIVDDRGDEIALDRKGTLAFNGVQPELGKYMAEQYSHETNQEVAAWLLERSNAYREGVERGTPRRGSVPSDVRDAPQRLYRYPAHSFSAWTSDDLEEYSTFVGVRVYEVQKVSSEDGTAIIDRTERLVFESEPDGREED